jgi:hypothetical protein
MTVPIHSTRLSFFSGIAALVLVTSLSAAPTPIRSTPFPVLGGHAVALQDRFVPLMGSADYPTYRVGKTNGRKDPFWTGYGDRILCYDVEKDNYSHVGVMPYGVATSHWVTDGQRLYNFGGEPGHMYNENTENVLQIGLIVASIQ